SNKEPVPTSSTRRNQRSSGENAKFPLCPGRTPVGHRQDRVSRLVATSHSWSAPPTPASLTTNRWLFEKNFTGEPARGFLSWPSDLPRGKSQRRTVPSSEPTARVWASSENNAEELVPTSNTGSVCWKSVPKQRVTRPPATVKTDWLSAVKCQAAPIL